MERGEREGRGGKRREGREEERRGGKRRGGGGEGRGGMREILQDSLKRHAGGEFQKMERGGKGGGRDEGQGNTIMGRQRSSMYSYRTVKN